MCVLFSPTVCSILPPKCTREVYINPREWEVGGSKGGGGGTTRLALNSKFKFTQKPDDDDGKFKFTFVVRGLWGKFLH